MITVCLGIIPELGVAKQPKKRVPPNSFDFACNVIDYSTLTSGDIIEPAREQLFGQADRKILWTTDAFPKYIDPACAFPSHKSTGIKDPGECFPTGVLDRTLRGGH